MFSSKQLEELESIHDGSSVFDENADDSDNIEEGGDTALAWRRSMIEEAVNNVKRATARPVDPKITYEIGSLLFDREGRRFGRVRRSVPGYLQLAYLTGGEREYGEVDTDAYLAQFGSTKRPSELAESLGADEGEIRIRLIRLGIQPIEEEPIVEEEVVAEPSVELPEEPMIDMAEFAAAEVTDVASVDEDDLLPMVPQDPEPEPVVALLKTKPKAKHAPAETKRAPAAKKSAKGASSAKKSPIAPAGGGASANPIDDPNAFIKQNFQAMSNRELARATGLSEHTIRRKLGEWRLRRLA